MRAVAACCLTLGLLLSACAGGDPPTAAPAARPDQSGAAGTPDAATPKAPDETDGAEGTSDPRETQDSTPVGASETPATAPQPPPPTDDRRGRIAFAEYVLQAWIHALNTNDVQPLLEVSGPRPCNGCTALAEELRSRAAQGWYVALGGVRVSSTQLGVDGRNVRAVMSVAIPESDSYHDDGSFRSSNPAHPGSTFEVEMVREAGSYRLLSFSLY